MKRFLITLITLFSLSLTMTVKATASMIEILSEIDVEDGNIDTPDTYTNLDSLISSVYKPVYEVRSENLIQEDFQTVQPLSANSGAENTYVPISVQIDRSKSVGSIPFKSGTSQTGGKTYEIAIDAPAGMNGFKPNISLSYDSQRGFSALGKGWYLSGISIISRTPRTVYYDSLSGGVSNSLEDAFLLDGRRLIKSGDFQGCLFYETELGNIQVKCHYTGDIVQYFEVFYPNGNKGIFGYPDSAENRLIYPLTKLTDLNGNNIAYEYIFSDNIYDVSKVSYNGSSIEFIYTEGRKDPMMSFTAGIKMYQNKLLQSVICKEGDEETRTYRLSYIDHTDDYGHTTNSLLSSIDLSSGEISLNPLQFLYGSGSQRGMYKSSTTQLPVWYDSEDPDAVRIVKGRFDYASADDGILILPNKNPYVQEQSGTTDRYINLYKGDEKIFVYSLLNGQMAMELPNLLTEEGFIDILTADLEGKQEELIVKINNRVENKRDIVSFTVYRSNSKFGTTKLYTRNFDMGDAFEDKNHNISVAPKFFYTGDFNGDGKMDIMSISSTRPFKNIPYGTKCYVFDLEVNKKYEIINPITYFVQFFGNLQKDPVAASNNTDRLLVFDYDGDGKTDLCHISRKGMYVYAVNSYDNSMGFSNMAEDTEFKVENINNKEILCGEFNGDGMTDLLVSPTTNTDSADWQICYSKGNGCFDKKTFKGVSRKNSSKDKYIIQDIDGDGKTDFVWLHGGSISTYLNRGDIPNVFMTSRGDSISWVVPTNINSPNIFSQLICLNKGFAIKHSFSRHQNLESMLTGFVNSHGVIERNSYMLLTDPAAKSSVYSKGYDAAFPFVNLMESIPVVTTSDVLFNGSCLETWSYSYTNAVAHRQGKGLCGFGKIESTSSLGRKVVSEYDPYNFGVMLAEKNQERERTYKYNVLTKSTKISQVNPEIFIEKDLLKGFTATTSYKAYDLFGYPSIEETMYSDGSKTESNSVYLCNSEVKDGYNLGFLSNRVITHTCNGKTFEERMHITESTRRLPCEKLVYKDLNRIEKITYEYDNHGNLLSESVQPFSSQISQKTTYSYDSQGKISKITYPTGLSKKYSYDKRGLLKSVCDIRGESTIFVYDNFGRETSVIYSDSTTKTVERKWDREAGSLYSVTVRQTGRPDSTIYYDAFDREVRCVEKRMDGSLKKIDKRYDIRGNLWKVSLPDKTNEPSVWNEFEYDQYGRILKSKESTGKITTYTYSGNTVTENDGKTSTTRKYDVFGNLVSLTDASGTASYEYAADGQLTKITVHGNIVTSMSYDKYRRQTSLTDPSLGEVTYTYDSSGNVASQTDADGRTVSYEYDYCNRLKKKTCEEFTSTYTYDTYGSLSSVTADNGTSTAYTYDSHGRISGMKEEGLDGVWLKTDYVYRDGNISAAAYTSAKGRLATEKYYYTNGHLREVILDDKTVVYRLNGENSYGQQTWIQSGPLTRKYVHTGFGLPHNRMAYTTTDTLQNQGYLFDPKTGNMLTRTDNIRGITESFSYDSQNRLTKFGNTSVSYDAKGNIQSKGDVGSFTYGLSDKPYAVSGVTLTGNAIPSDTQEISYTSFSRAASITEGEMFAEFDYNSDGDRVRMTVTKDGQRLLTRNYLGSRYESELSGSYLHERLYLGGDCYSAPTMIERTSFAVALDTVKPGPIGPLEPWKPSDADIAESSSASSSDAEIATRVGTRVYFLLRDCIGSITHIVSSDGKVVQELSYDAWGRFRNPETHELYAIDKQPSPKFGRGYTGHEHLSQFGLINMNARLYDPILGRFLSPDPYVQIPEWLQNFNRYTYAMNNPLCYVDEDGEFFWLIIGAAALVGAVTNLAVHWEEIHATGGWKGFWKGAAYFGIGAGAGALGAAAGLGASAWIGSMLGIAASASYGATLGVLPGAFVGAANGFTESLFLNTSNSLMQGEDFGSALRNGLVHAGMDAAFGAVTGGVSGGVRAHKKGLNLIDGSEKKIYTGYYGFEGEDHVKYVGITGRDPQIRYNEHFNSGTEKAFLRYEEQAYFDTKLKARIWEQIQINKFGMQKFGGQLLNKRNEIARKFWHEHGIIP